MRSALVLGLLGASLQAAQAHPTAAKTTNKQLGRRTLDGTLGNYRLKQASVYTSSAKSSADEAVASMAKRADYVETATELAHQLFPGAEFRVVGDHYVSPASGVAHVHLKQRVNGVDVTNADANVNVGRDGAVFSYGSSFYKGEMPAKVASDVVAPLEALKIAISELGLPVSGMAGATVEPLDDESEMEAYVISGLEGVAKDIEARLRYYIKADGSGLALTWQLEADLKQHWLQMYVDADGSSSGLKVHGVADWVSSATYEVYPWGVESPDKGEREVLTDPWAAVESEFTWQSDGDTNYTITRGNNGRAVIDLYGTFPSQSPGPDAGESLAFEYEYSPDMSDPVTYQDASATQLWYTANKFHDQLYALGFDEAAGNFEMNNNGAGGEGSDGVFLSVQDSMFTNNAMFASPPDGTPGVMFMFLWDAATPVRDCTFEADVVMHEYTHGLSGRLTGGAANSNCLSGEESGGMGEGWSDYFAIASLLKSTDTRDDDKVIGAWVYNSADGLRSVPYSTDMERNPNTYETLNGIGSEPHDIGETWGTVLFELMWNLADKYGHDDSDMPELDGATGVPTDGRFLAMKLVLDGMALQPCNPGFLEARDAIVDADVALTGGANLCEVWGAFAKRGMGEDAAIDGDVRTNGFAVPEGVC